MFARDLRKRRPRPTARWHLDEMVIKIAGKRHWLWRAVDDEGKVLDVLVQAGGIHGPPPVSAGHPSLLCRLWTLARFAHAQAHHKASLRTRDDHDRWARLVRSRATAARSDGSTRATAAPQQPGRKLASADAPARAQDAAVQVAGVCPTLLVRSCCRPQRLQRRAPSHLTQNPEAVPGSCHETMAWSHCVWRPVVRDHRRHRRALIRLP